MYMLLGLLVAFKDLQVVHLVEFQTADLNDKF